MIYTTFKNDYLTIDLMHNDVTLIKSRRVKLFKNGCTVKCFEDLIWPKIKVRTNKLQYLFYNLTFS